MWDLMNRASKIYFHKNVGFNVIIEKKCVLLLSPFHDWQSYKIIIDYDLDVRFTNGEKRPYEATEKCTIQVTSTLFLKENVRF